MKLSGDRPVLRWPFMHDFAVSSIGGGRICLQNILPYNFHMTQTLNSQHKSAATKRRRSLEAYMAAPNICRFCNDTILPQTGQKISQVRAKQFCDSTCAASLNNQTSPKRKPTRPSSGECQTCGTTVQFKKRPKCGFYYRRFCEPCLRVHRADVRGAGPTSNRTKGELFTSRGKYQSARSSIRRHAYNTFVTSGQPLECCICKYDKHVDVCHVVPVSSFSSESLISEINAISNLVAMCPNHHWEYDNGLLVLPTRPT